MFTVYYTFHDGIVLHQRQFTCDNEIAAQAAVARLKCQGHLEAFYRRTGLRAG